MIMGTGAEIRWIDVAGGVAEQMLRYAQALRMARRGENVGVAVYGPWIGRLFPGLPPLAIRRAGAMERLGMWLRRPADDGSWMDYENVEALGNDAAGCFSLQAGKTPKGYREIGEILSQGETVAVHVLSPRSSRSTCTSDYFNWAAAGMRQWLENPRFVVVTDDERWCRRRLQLGDARYVELPSRRHGLIFEALRHAKHNIISNDLASWWGAWLNANPDKIVAAPSRWTPDGAPTRLLPLHWTIVPTT